MTRNIKALGLAMAAFLALGAVYAAGASAQQGMLTSDGPVTLTGEEVGTEENRLTVTDSFIECPGSTFTGHTVVTHEETTLGETHGFLSSGATEATITPHYKQEEDNCTGTGGSSSTVHMNGCDYVVKLGQTTGTQPEVGGTYGVAFDIVCPPGQEITTTTWYTKFAHTNGGTVRCVNHVPPQSDLTGAHATDEGNGHIKLEGEVVGITVQKTVHSDPLGVCPEAGHETNGKFDLNVTIHGHDELGETTDVSLSHTA